MLAEGKKKYYSSRQGRWIMRITKPLLFLCCFIFLIGCEEGAVSGMDSTAPNPQEQDPNQQKDTENFAITNDFNSHTAKDGVFIYLVGNNGQNYTLPPTQYSPLELEYVIVSSLKVEGECVKVPKEAFPLSVYVCETSKCQKVRPLDLRLVNPAHYNINGVGGLITPRISPVSPCSEDFLKRIKDVKLYQEI